MITKSYELNNKFCHNKQDNLNCAIVCCTCGQPHGSTCDNTGYLTVSTVKPQNEKLILTSHQQGEGVELSTSCLLMLVSPSSLTDMTVEACKSILHLQMNVKHFLHSRELDILMV
jgi:predicted metallo-beta-lactamase superfamily hydrolase